jgi:colanic acid biosynthesis glycosyl transferase WcaI
MRILLLTQWFDPEPTIKGLPFAHALMRAGHDVHVITGFPNYPGGKVYPGYRVRLWQHELMQGVPVTRVLLYPSHDHSALGRVLNYVSFAISATVAGMFTSFKADVMYVYHPPLTVGLSAMVIGAFRRVPFVYDIQDLWPDTLQATGMVGSRTLLRFVGWLVGRVYGSAALLVAQSPGFVGRLIARGVPAHKVRLVYNWCDEEALSARAADPGIDLTVFEGRFNVVFAGNMGKAQALESVVEAAALVAERDARVQFVFVGGGTDLRTLETLVQSRGLSNVVFVARLEMSQVGHVFDHADALLVHLRNTPLFEITLPSKTQAYMFAAKPIIMAVHGDAATLVTLAKAGVCATPEDPVSIADAVLALANLSAAERVAIGARGRRFYDESLSVERGTQHMIEAFEEAVRSRARGLTDGRR